MGCSTCGTSTDTHWPDCPRTASTAPRVQPKLRDYEAFRRGFKQAIDLIEEFDIEVAKATLKLMEEL